MKIGDKLRELRHRRKLSVREVALRSGGFDDASLAGAVAIYDDPADLLARLAGSPLGAGSP